MSLIFQVYEKVVDYKHSGSANDRRAVRQRIMNRIADAGAVAPFNPPPQEPEGEIVDNIEGITFGPKLPNGNQSLLLVTDDNFQIYGKQLNQFILLEIQLNK